MSGVCWQIAGLLGKFAGIYWFKKINYFKTNENQALVGVFGGDVKIHLTNCLRVIRNAWHFHYALVLVFKVVCGGFCIALLTP
ncbi:hypothetical protein ACS8UU_004504 [Vibrio parahaemolyticus]